jgi:hypothetical protein
MKEKNQKIVVKNSKFRKISFFNEHMEIYENVFSSKITVSYDKVSKLLFEKYFYSHYIDDCMTIDYTGGDGKKKKIVIEVTERVFNSIEELLKGRKIIIEKKAED